MRRRDKILIIVGVVLTLLTAARIALPYGLERAIDRGLMAMEGYQGSVGDVDLALWNGAYHIEDIQIVRTGADPPRPFFNCDRVDLEIEWRSLMKGSLVATGELWRPKLNLVQAKTKEESQLGTETDWPTYLADLYPFDVNTVRVIDGTVTFRAPGIRTQDALTANGVNAVISNLTNVNDSAAETFARFDVNARVLAEAPARISGSVDPLAKKPTFDVNMSLEGVELPDVNPWLRQYLKADAQAGTFQLYLELAAADGAFEGYAKPLMQDVNMYGTQDKEQNLTRKVWEGLVEFAANIVENPEEKQVGARIPFSGTIDKPQANIWQTIVSVLRNAFVSAFARSLESSISLRDVKKNLSELGESSGIQSPEDKDDDEKKDDAKSDREERPKRRGPRATG